jgi:hypothetical protein
MSTDSGAWPFCLPKQKYNSFEGIIFGIIPWLEICNLFQTFEDLDNAKDVRADAAAMRQLLQTRGLTEDHKNDSPDPDYQGQ